MCGIVGSFLLDGTCFEMSMIQSALDKISHRGPDDQGYEITNIKNGCLIMGHTRLSIIDLSSAGHQPFFSKCLRYSMVYNGEIYNFIELRKELEGMGCCFETASDTEVLLQAWIFWGEEVLSRLEGMFAFVIFDSERNELHCVRDAFGIKPFFYSMSDDEFIFASELPALLTLRTAKKELNWQRCYDYIAYGDYDSTEDTFVKGVKHLLPGNYLKLQLDGKDCIKFEIKRWWQPDITTTSALSFTQAVESVREAFLKNIRMHLRSDVPLGAALSGGIDSSAVVCAIRYLEPDMPIHTFSYIASNSILSEEKWVDAINLFSDCQAHKVYTDSTSLRDNIESMILEQGEPFGGTSIFAQRCVFKLAKEKGITVTLDGQGADELLAGYEGYPGQHLLSLIEKKGLVQANRYAIQWGQYPNRSYSLAWKYFFDLILPEKIALIARRWLGKNASPKWLHIDKLLEQAVNLDRKKIARSPLHKGNRVKEQLAYSLQNRGLPSLLRHGDRNAMAFSIESRVPFLTVSFANLLLSLPEEYLVSEKGETKHIFREAMRGIVPDEILDRKDKIGFATPESEWMLKNPDLIREWLRHAQNIPFINYEELLSDFELIVEGKKKYSPLIWRCVNFLQWSQFIMKEEC